MSEKLDLHALADNELCETERTRMLEKLNSCEKSQKEYQSVLQLKSLISSKCESTTCQETWKKCQQRLHKLDEKSRVERFVTRNAWGMCGIIFMIVLGGAYLNRTQDDSVRTGDVARMVAGLSPFNRGNNSTPVEDLSKWLPKPLNVNLGNLMPLAANRGSFMGRPVTVVDVADMQGSMTLIFMDGIDEITGLERMVEDSRYCCGKLGTQNCVSWQIDGMTVLMVGQRSPAELSLVADQIQLQ